MLTLVHDEVLLRSACLPACLCSDGSSDLPPEIKAEVDIALFRSPLVTEAVLCHKSSKTLCTADSGFWVRMSAAQASCRAHRQTTRVVWQLERHRPA